MPITISPDIMPFAMAKKPPAHLLQSFLQVSSFHTTTVHPSVYNINNNQTSRRSTVDGASRRIASGLKSVARWSGREASAPSMIVVQLRNIVRRRAMSANSIPVNSRDIDPASGRSLRNYGMRPRNSIEKKKDTISSCFRSVGAPPRRLALPVSVECRTTHVAVGSSLSIVLKSCFSLPAQNLMVDPGSSLKHLIDDRNGVDTYFSSVYYGTELCSYHC